MWLIVRLRTDAGLTGLGEACDAFGFANTTRQDAAQMESTLRTFFSLVQGRSPREVGAYRAAGLPMAAKGGLVAATAFSAIEQALWDLTGKALDVPTCTLFGGAVRSSLPCYANVNRATNPRTPTGFAAAAKAAAAEGFKAVKAAPWDGFPPAGSSAKAIETAIELGIDSTAAMRQAIGPDVELMVDCHSFFDVAMAERVPGGSSRSACAGSSSLSRPSVRTTRSRFGAVACSRWLGARCYSASTASLRSSGPRPWT